MSADGFSSLEEQMNGKEFTAAGLNKLSQEELDVLNAWIRKHSLATLDTPTASSAMPTDTTNGDQRGLKSDDSDDDDSPIKSRILGDFDGWDGQTIFKLENGMIWVQADKDKFFIKSVENPMAIIKPGMFGTWRLHIEGYGSECKVKRIQ
jgi:hypothetical protein